MSDNRKRKSRTCESGQGLVEFAMVFSMLVLLLCMAVDTARIVDAKILLQSAACESVRHVTSRETMTREVTDALKGDYDRLDSVRLQVGVTGDSTQRRNYIYHAHNGGGGWYGDYRFAERNSYITYFDATVKLTYTVPIITPVGRLFFGSQQVMSSSYTKMVFLEGYS